MKVIRALSLLLRLDVVIVESICMYLLRRVAKIKPLKHETATSIGLLGKSMNLLGTSTCDCRLGMIVVFASKEYAN